MNNLDRFAWVGAFSSGGLGAEFEKQFPALDAKSSAQLRLFWLSCGKDDFLIEPNRKLRDWFLSKDIKFKWLETDGAHTWQVWRRNLTDFAALLFQTPAR